MIVVLFDGTFISSVEGRTVIVDESFDGLSKVGRFDVVQNGFEQPTLFKY